MDAKVSRLLRFCSGRRSVISDLDLKRVLFIGIGPTPICYYRCMLPALAMGCDWVGVSGKPPKFHVNTGIVKGSTQTPKLLHGDYDIVVVQQPHGPEWLDLIARMQDKGVKVIFEIDDYLHAIRHMEDHTSRDKYHQQLLAEIEQGMQACDGLIVSTKWLKIKYGKFNSNAFVCQNGIDLRRYELERPTRPLHSGGKRMVSIGWAAGHLKAIAPWLLRVSQIMQLRENTTFVSIGQPFADDFKKAGWGNRALAVPFAAIEQYPAAMTLLDIALAPAGKSRFHRGKSDLRWVEASALGIPVIANPTIYDEIVNGETGFTASDPEQMTEYLLRLIDSPDLRDEVGQAAKRYIEKERTIQVLKKNWERTFERVLAQ